MNVVWFRSDLRVNSNPALNASLADDSNQTVGIYCLCLEQMNMHGVGVRHQALVLEAVINLKNALAAINVPLYVVDSKTYSQTVQWMEKSLILNQVEHVYFNIEQGWNERQRDRRLEIAVRERILLRPFHGNSLIPITSVTTQQNQGFKVYSAFQRMCLKHLEGMTTDHFSKPIQNSIKPTKFQCNENLEIKQLRMIQSQLINEDDRQFMPDVEESSVQRQLKSFLRNHLDQYGENRDFPAISGTSRLSAALSVGSISVLDCYQQALGFDPVTSSKWRSELLWREFYRSVMWFYPRVSKGQAFLSVERYIHWDVDERLFNLWCSGNTGIPLIDAAMNQLNQTGWMHNRLRMVVASYLCKNLWLNWRLGETYFASQLWDFDFASNNGGWQWCASVGTDASPYFRVFNPENQALKFDPQAQFIKKWLPQLKQQTPKAIHRFSKSPLPNYWPELVNLKLSRQKAIDTFRHIKQNALH